MALFALCLTLAGRVLTYNKRYIVSTEGTVPKVGTSRYITLPQADEKPSWSWMYWKSKKQDVKRRNVALLYEATKKFMEARFMINF